LSAWNIVFVKVHNNVALIMNWFI